MKRIVLFLATNLAILLVLSVSMRLLGVEPWLNEQGLNLTALLIFAAVMGFGGSLISLAVSKWMAKKMMGVRVIKAPSNTTEAWLVDTVRKYARQAGIGMPEVGIYDAPDVNAFATGMSRNKALIAVSTGLLQQMTREEAEAVLGHEVAHAANGDMVTLALIQGVVNTFVMFFARIFGNFVDKAILKNEDGHGIGYFVATIFAELVLGILASIIVMWFSRKREFKADEAGARLAGTGSMIAALQRLRAEQGVPVQMPDSLTAFGINGGLKNGLAGLLMTHPPLEDRIEALRRLG